MSVAAFSAVHCVVHGRVQGVGFRYTARETACRLKLHGWVRNTEQGTVELFAEGPVAQIERFLAWLRRGPPGSRVEQLEVAYKVYSNLYSRFTVEY